MPRIKERKPKVIQEPVAQERMPDDIAATFRQLVEECRAGTHKNFEGLKQALQTVSAVMKSNQGACNGPFALQGTYYATMSIPK